MGVAGGHVQVSIARRLPGHISDLERCSLESIRESASHPEEPVHASLMELDAVAPAASFDPHVRYHCRCQTLTVVVVSDYTVCDDAHKPEVAPCSGAPHVA
jgi:hypothetical protein